VYYVEIVAIEEFLVSKAIQNFSVVATDPTILNPTTEGRTKPQAFNMQVFI